MHTCELLHFNNTAKKEDWHTCAHDTPKRQTEENHNVCFQCVANNHNNIILWSSLLMKKEATALL